MDSIRNDTIEGINTFITEQKKDPENTRFTYVQFDNHYEVVHDNIAMPEVPLVDNKTFVPRGMTALLDAIGKTITRASTYIEAQPVQDRPEKVVLVIVTDGHENASQQFNKAQVRELVTSKQNIDDWQIIYLGANQNAILQAAQYGIRGTTSMNYSAGTKGVKAAYTAAAVNVRGLKAGVYEGIKFDSLQRTSSTADSVALQNAAVDQYTAAGIDVSANAPVDPDSSGQTAP
jgi:hypothetical protein